MFSLDPHHQFALYTRKRRYLTSNDPELEYRPEMSLTEVVLFRYVDERFFDPVRPYSYWTELETAWSDFAGAAVGIGLHSCKYRIEWHCPMDVAIENVGIGGSRMGPAGVIREYTVRIEVKQDDIIWHEMNDWGPFPKR